MSQPGGQSAFGWFVAGVLLNLMIFPLNHVAGALANGGDYTPFSVAPSVGPMVYDETAYYAIGPGRFMKSGRLSGDLDTFELRDIPNASYPMLHSILLGSLGRLTGRLERAWMIAHAVLPAVTWALLFWYAFRWIGGAVAAAAVAWAVCFIAFGPRNFLLLSGASFTQPLELTRLTAPCLGFAVLLSAIWQVGAALAGPTPTRLGVAGVAAGLVLYAYYFYWVALFGGLFFLFLILLSGRRAALAWRLCVIVGVAAVMGVPLAVRTLSGLRDPHQTGLMARFGGFARTPDWLGLIVAAAALATLWTYARSIHDVGLQRRHAVMLAILAVISGAAVGLNLHLLTGFNAQHEHFYNRVLQPMLAYVGLLALAGSAWLSRRVGPGRLAAVGVLSIAIMLGLAAVRQIEVGRRTAAAHRASDPDADVLAWLRTNSTADTVIGARDGYLINEIPAVTGGWTFVPMGYRSLNDSGDTVTRWLALARIELGSWDAVEAELNTDPGFTWDTLPVSRTFIVQRSQKPDMVALMKARWAGIDPAKELASRRLDYLVTRRDRALPVLNGAPLGAVAYENAVWRVVRR